MTASLNARMPSGLKACLAVGVMIASISPILPSAHAAELLKGETGKSFVDDFHKFDTKRWYISDGWNNGKHQNCTWSKKQVSLSKGKLSLKFAAQKLKDRDHVCGEVQTRKRFGYGTYEIRMKAAAGSGLNTGFFTYIGDADKQPHDEIDFEVLGKDPSKVQLNQFVGGKKVGEEKLVPVEGGADKDFHDYAFVWEKDRIRWYVDGKLLGEATDPAKIPTHASKIFVSLWGSDTLKSWMGPFTETEAPVTAEVERIAFTALGDKCQFPQSIACKLQ